VAPVEEVTHAEAPPAKEGSNEDRIGKDVYHKMRAFWSWAAGGILILAVGIAALCWRYRHQTTLKAGDAVVIADFENHTGDPAFEDSLKLALETELVQTPFLDVLGSDKVRSALKLIITRKASASPRRSQGSLQIHEQLCCGHRIHPR